MLFELDEQAPPETEPACLGHDVHALQLGPSLVEAADAATPERAPVIVAHDEEHAVGRHEHVGDARRPDVGDAAVTAAHLRLLRLGERRARRASRTAQAQNASKRHRVARR